MLPQLLAGYGIEAANALCFCGNGFGGRARGGCGWAIHHEQPMADDGGAAIPPLNWNTPQYRRTGIWKTRNESGFPPAIVPLWPHPLRPIVSTAGRSQKEASKCK